MTAPALDLLLLLLSRQYTLLLLLLPTMGVSSGAAKEGICC
jgi:hypothetical protein